MKNLPDRHPFGRPATLSFLLTANEGSSHTLLCVLARHPWKEACIGPRGPWGLLHLQAEAAETDFTHGCSYPWPGAVTEPTVLQQRLAGTLMS